MAALGEMLQRHGSRFEQALLTDLGKAPAESVATEIGFLTTEVTHVRRRLRQWLRPTEEHVPWQLQPASARTVLEPLGVALVIAPWNYPLMLALSPVIGALGAGNAVVLKPSELAPATSALLAELLPATVDPRAVAVVEGGVPETTGLLEQRFDTIFYTGNGRVGRIVMAAAARHLTPVTLELGGKSPAYVDASADVAVAARRIAWGKYVNAGQTCVAPDHVLAHHSIADELVDRIEHAVTDMYGAEPLASRDLTRIVSPAHFDRLTGMLSDGRIAVGGTSDRGTLKIAPTVLTDVPDTAESMQQEIFGPLLPVIRVAREQDAIDRVAAGDKPLALYVFTSGAESRRRWTTATSSGAIGFDIPVAHLIVPGIPFGGVGPSGMGSYHGRRSILAFSHEKAIFAKRTRPDTLRLFIPPYTAGRERLIRRLFR